MAKSLPTHAELVEYKHAVAGQYAHLPATQKPISDTFTAMARFAMSMVHSLSNLASRPRSTSMKPP